MIQLADRALALYVADLDLIPASHMVPRALPGIIPECEQSQD